MACLDLLMTVSGHAAPRLGLQHLVGQQAQQIAIARYRLHT
jgi:hypothetical protein